MRAMSRKCSLLVVILEITCILHILNFLPIQVQASLASARVPTHQPSRRPSSPRPHSPSRRPTLHQSHSPSSRSFIPTGVPTSTPTGIPTSMPSSTLINEAMCDIAAALQISPTTFGWQCIGKSPVDNVCKWKGISCSAGLTGIYIDSTIQNLGGSISPSIGKISSLQYLILWECSVRGSIPDEIGQLENLLVLYLVGNALSGSIPHSVGTMTSLTYLNVEQNRLDGALPSSIGSLSNMINFVVANNALSKTIPSEIGLLTNLVTLSATNNILSGGIPTTMGGMLQLQSLYLDQNSLSGSIPTEIGLLHSLYIIVLDSNRLNGSIPTVIGEWMLAYVLDLHSNKLTGSIPMQIGNLTNLVELYLFDNFLIGSIPSTIGKCSLIFDFDVSSNLLTGAIPAVIGEFTGLTNFNLSTNRLHGSIPAHVGNLTNLYYLSLENNLFTGTIPSTIYSLRLLQGMDLSNNFLESSNLSSMIGYLDKLIVLNLYSANLVGTIPTEILLLTDLSAIDLSLNSLSGSVPSFTSQTLTFVFFRENKLSGSIPTALYSLTQLTRLTLAYNLLTGTVASAIGYLTALNILQLDNNLLNGTIPSEVGYLRHLTVLTMHKNFFTGSVTPLLCTVKFTQFRLCTDCGDLNTATREGCPHLSTVPYCLFTASYYQKCIGSLAGEFAEPPNLSVILANTSSTGVLLAVNVSSINYLYLTCSAFNRGTNISSISQLETSAPSQFITSKFQLYPILHLLPATNYDTYCFARSLYGVPMSLTSVISTKFGVQTACCKRVDFTRTPVFVTHNNSGPGTAFYYVLSSAPSDQITVVHSVNNSEAATVQHTATFTYNSLSLQGSFLLNGPPGVYVVSLTLEGSSALEFDRELPIATVSILPYLLPVLQAPILISAIFADSGGSALVTFDVGTDLARTQSIRWECDSLFNFSGASACSCSWLNNSVVLIVFPVHSSLVTLPIPGDALALRSGILRAACFVLYSCLGNEASPTQHIFFQIPISPVIPTVILGAPSMVGLNDSLVIDPTSSIGGGGRPWKSVSWNLTSDGVFNATLFQKSFLSPAGADINLQNQLRIPAGYLPPAVYTFSLVLQNYMGQYGVSTASVIIRGTPQLQQVSILGPKSIGINVFDELLLQSVVESGILSSLVYNWFIYSKSEELVNITSQSVDPRIFRLEAYSLVALQGYIIRVNVSSDYGVATAEVNVFVKLGSVQAYIIGGDQRVAYASAQLALDATASRDLKNPSGALGFTWDCRVASGLSYGLSCADIIPSGDVNRAIVIIPEYSLEADYIFTVRCSSGDGRSGTASVIVHAVAGSGPQALLSSLVTRVSQRDILRIDGSISATRNVTTTWNISTTGSVVQLSDIAITPISRSLEFTSARRSIGFSVGVDTTALLPGATYMFTLTTADAENPLVLSSATASITINVAPTLGILRVSPSVGISFDTTFNLASTGWVAERGGYPLQYDFRFSIFESEKFLTIGSLGLQNSVSTTLPAGPLHLVSRVYDVFGATASSSTEVVVRRFDETLDLLDTLHAALNASGRTYNVDLIFKTVNAIAIGMKDDKIANDTNVIDTVVRLMCDSVEVIAIKSDRSTSLLDALIATLSEVYAPGFVVTTSTLVRCATSLKELARLMPTFLSNSKLSLTSDSIVEIISSMLDTVHAFNTIGAADSSILNVAATNLNSVLVAMTSGLLNRMIDGQYPTVFNSSGIAMSVYNELFSDLRNLKVAAMYGLNSSVILPDTGLVACGNSKNSYSQLSIAQWNVNPYPNSSEIKTPLLRIASSKNSAGAIISNENFTLILAFSIPQNFTVTNSAILNTSYVPVCQLHSTTGNNSYQRCSCELITFSRYNSTFSCNLQLGFCGQLSPLSAISSSGASDSDDQTIFEYGALLQSVVNAIANPLLSTSPFSNVQSSAVNLTALLAFICWLFAFFGGIVYFQRWDKLEFSIKLYGGLTRREPIRRPSSLTFDELQRRKSIVEDNFRKKVAADDDELFIEYSKEYNKRTNLYFWLNCVLCLCIPFGRPRRALSSLVSKNLVPRFKDAVLRFHPLTWFFVGSSIEKPRVLRFMSTLQGVLVSIFISSIFFSVFYPADSTCTVYNLTTKAQCLSIPSLIVSGDSECSWDDSTKLCTVQAPPDSLQFTIVLAILTIVIHTPISVSINYCLHNVCNKLPNLEVFGLDRTLVLGNYTSKVVATLVDATIPTNYVLRAIRAFELEVEDDLCDANQMAVMKFVLSRYGLRLRGRKVELTFVSSLFNKNIGECIARKLKYSHRKALAISQNANHSGREKYLLQTFFLEKVGLLSRIGLARDFQHYLYNFPQYIHPFKWLLGWAYVVGSIIFFSYWVLAYAINNIQGTENQWAINSSIHVLQEMLASSIIRIFIVNIVLVELCRPFLHRTEDLILTRRDIFAAQRTESKLLQFLSPSCVASQLNEFKSLTTATCLSNLSDTDFYSIHINKTEDTKGQEDVTSFVEQARRDSIRNSSGSVKSPFMMDV